MLLYQLIIHKVHLKRHLALTAEQASVPAVPCNAGVPACHSPWLSPESRIWPAGTQMNWENEGLQASEGPSKAYAYKILLVLLCSDNICYQDTGCLPMGFMALGLLLIGECLQLYPCRAGIWITDSLLASPFCLHPLHYLPLALQAINIS